MTRAEERKQAAGLRAVDVRELIKTSLPGVLPQLTATHIDQLQRILDVAVINADIEGRGAAIDRQAIRGRIVHSNEYLRNPAGVAQRNNVLAQKITLKPGENAIRLDLKRLLTPDALKPTSDNPDEAAYLLVVAEVYEQRGVWLVLDSSAGAMTQQMNPNEPRKWRVRLLLGFKPGALVEEIQTPTGSLNRNALLSVSRLGAGYYEWVHQGPTMRSLKSALDRLSKKITDGRNEHVWWSAHRDEYRIVSRISDKFGGADWPSENIWNQPHQIYIQALNLVNAGKLNESAKFALLAAYQAEWCGRAVHEYVNATTKGASRVVTILEIAQVCGEIAGWILSLLAVGQGMIRLLSRKGGQAALQGGAQRQLTGGQRQLPAGGQTTPTPVSRTPTPAPKPGTPTVADGAHTAGPPARPPAGGVAKDKGSLVDAVDQLRHQAGLPPYQGGTHFGRLGRAELAQYEKAHKEYLDWLTKNPNASLAEKFAKHDRDIVARFGNLD